MPSCFKGLGRPCGKSHRGGRWPGLAVAVWSGSGCWLLGGGAAGSSSASGLFSGCSQQGRRAVGSSVCGLLAAALLDPAQLSRAPPGRWDPNHWTPGSRFWMQRRAVGFLDPLEGRLRPRRGRVAARSLASPWVPVSTSSCERALREGWAQCLLLSSYHSRRALSGS